MLFTSVKRDVLSEKSGTTSRRICSTKRIASGRSFLENQELTAAARHNVYYPRGNEQTWSGGPCGFPSFRASQAKEEEGSVDGQIWFGKELYEKHHIQQLRCKGYQTARSDNWRWLEPCQVLGKPNAQSLGLRRVWSCFRGPIVES